MMTFTSYKSEAHRWNTAKHRLSRIALAGVVTAGLAIGATLAVTGADSSSSTTATAPTTLQPINTGLLYDVAVDVPAAVPERPAFDTPIERLIEANRTSVVPAINPALLYDVAVDVPAAVPERPAFDTPIERLIEANKVPTMNLGSMAPDGFTRWFEGS